MRVVLLVASRTLRSAGLLPVGAVLMMTATGLWAAPALADSGSPAATNLESGYWWEAEASGSQVPPPPDVPAGGLWVSSNSSGPQAVSAIRFDLLDGGTSPVVTLRISQEQPSGQLSMVACPATSDWTPPSGPGQWSSRPSADCSRGQAVAQIDSAGTTATIDLTSLVSSTGQVNVVLLPTSSSDPTNGSAPVQSPEPVYATFDATFDPVTASEVSAMSSPSPVGSDGTGMSGLPDVGAPSLVNAGPLSSYPGIASPLETLLNPVLPAGSPPALAVPSVPATPAASPSRIPQAYTPAVSAPRSWRQRVLLSLILIDLVAYLMWSGSRASAGGLARLSIYEIPGGSARRRPRPGVPPALR